MSYNPEKLAGSPFIFHSELPKTIQKTKPKVNVSFTTAVQSTCLKTTSYSI